MNTGNQLILLWVSSWYCWQKHELYIPVLFNGSMLIFSLQKMFIQKLLDILFVIKIKLFKIKLCYLSIWLLLLKALAQIHYRFQNISICEVDAVTVYCISTYHQNWHDKLQLLHLTLNKKKQFLISTLTLAKTCFWEWLAPAFSSSVIRFTICTKGLLEFLTHFFSICK